MYNCHRELKELKKLGIEIFVDAESGADVIALAAPEQDGFLNDFEANECISFKIVISTPRSRNIIPAVVYGKEKKINLLGDKSPSDDRATYRKNVPTRLVFKGLSGYFTTQYVDNNARIFRIDGNRFQMWEIAVVTRIKYYRSLYFLTIQKVYEADMYNDSGKIWVSPYQFPGFVFWASLRRLLEERVDVFALPGKIPEKTGEHQEEGEINEYPNEIYGGGSIGRVIFFNLANGKGKIYSDDFETLTVHWSKIKTKERFAHLLGGQLVTFKNVMREEKTENYQAEEVIVLKEEVV